MYPHSPFSISSNYIIHTKNASTLLQCSKTCSVLAIGFIDAYRFHTIGMGVASSKMLIHPPTHQCGGDLVSPPKETVVQNGSMSLKKLQQFCSVCEIFYKYGTVHQCQTVKCIVCQALGRETSLVRCGSTCPSCGVTATLEYSKAV